MMIWVSQASCVDYKISEPRCRLERDPRPRRKGREWLTERVHPLLLYLKAEPASLDCYDKESYVHIYIYILLLRLGSGAHLYLEPVSVMFYATP